MGVTKREQIPSSQNKLGCRVESKKAKVTLKQGRQSRVGYSSMSPVLILKQAPCQGQRSLLPTKTPAMHKPRKVLASE